MARRHIREVAPHTDGPIQTWLDEHDVALDAIDALIAAGGGIISQQTLGADTPDVTFAVTDSDEAVEIVCFGNAALGNVTLQVNGGGTAVTNSDMQQTSGGAVGGATSLLFPTYDGPFFAILHMAIKNLGVHRLGTCRSIAKNTASVARDHYVSSVVWPDASANVTSLVLHSSVATGFKQGGLYICRRKKFS